MLQQNFQTDGDEDDTSHNLRLFAEQVAGPAADFHTGEADDEGHRRDDASADQETPGIGEQTGLGHNGQ